MSSVYGPILFPNHCKKEPLTSVYSSDQRQRMVFGDSKILNDTSVVHEQSTYCVIAHFKNITYLCKNIQKCNVTMHTFYVIIFKGVCTSVECKCTLSKSLCVVCGHEAGSCYWIINDQAFSPSSDFVAPSPCPPIRQKALRATHRKTKKERQLANERGGSAEHFCMINMVHYFFFYPKLTSCHPPFSFSYPITTNLFLSHTDPFYLSVSYPLITTFFLSN